MSFIPYDPILLILAITILLEIEILILILLVRKIKKHQETDEELEKIIKQKVNL